MTAAGPPGVVGHHVQKHVVMDQKKETDKCKLLPKMGVLNVKVYQGRLKAVMIKNVKVDSLMFNITVVQKDLEQTSICSNCPKTT